MRRASVEAATIISPLAAMKTASGRRAVRHEPTWHQAARSKETAVEAFWAGLGSARGMPPWVRC
jgi:hypothetical protein